MAIATRVHVGVVASGDLEVLLEPSSADRVESHASTPASPVSVRCGRRFWIAFSAISMRAVAVEINDFGATPGLVMLRLEQAAEALLT